MTILKLDYSDITYYTTTYVVATLEFGGSIIVASSPSLRPLFDKMFHSIKSRTNSRLQRASDWRYGDASSARKPSQGTDEMSVGDMQERGNAPTEGVVVLDCMTDEERLKATEW